MQTYAAQRGQVRAVTDHQQHNVRVPTLGSTMSVPDMEADENGAGREHTVGWSQRDEIEAYWCPQPDWEADPGAFPGRMTVAPPREVSTQAKLVFPTHRSLAAHM